MEHHLWDRTTFVCAGISIALSSGLALAVHDTKDGTHAQPPAHSSSGSHTEGSPATAGTSSSIVQAEVR